MFRGENDCIFKNQWEQASLNIQLQKNKIDELLLAYVPYKVKFFKKLSNGCANLNYQIIFDGNHHPVVLRVYLRDPQAIDVEMGIHNFLKSSRSFTIPAFLYADSSCQLINHPYAILNFIEGDLMRDVIMKGDESDITQCALASGEALSCLKTIQFDVTGFFEKNMLIRPFSNNEGYEQFIGAHLTSKEIHQYFSSNTIKKIKLIIDEHRHLFSNLDISNLVHGDFDPSNILIKKTAGDWKIVGILDWEFSFSGSYFFDMGSMLRFSHKLPKCFKESFVSGVETRGKLPSAWEISAKLMDLLCLLDLLLNKSNQQRPKMKRDVIELIENFVNFFEV